MNTTFHSSLKAPPWLAGSAMAAGLAQPPAWDVAAARHVSCCGASAAGLLACCFCCWYSCPNVPPAWPCTSFIGMMPLTISRGGATCVRMRMAVGGVVAAVVMQPPQIAAVPCSSLSRSGSLCACVHSKSARHDRAAGRFLDTSFPAWDCVRLFSDAPNTDTSVHGCLRSHLSGVGRTRPQVRPHTRAAKARIGLLATGWPAPPAKDSVVGGAGCDVANSLSLG